MREQDVVKEIEELEIIESTELKIGNAFHAFRFRVEDEDPVKKDE